MCDKKTSEKALQDLLNLKNKVESSERAFMFLEEQAASSIELLKNTHQVLPDNLQTQVLDTDSIISQLNNAKQEYFALVYEYTIKSLAVSSAICKMSLPEKYSLIPEILLDKYIKGKDDRTIMENRHISKTTYWRWLQIGYENFEMPYIDESTL